METETGRPPLPPRFNSAERPNPSSTGASLVRFLHPRGHVQLRPSAGIEAVAT